VAASFAASASAAERSNTEPRSTVHRVLGRDRLRYDTGDRIAVCLGRHPSELWPEWFPTGEQGD